MIKFRGNTDDGKILIGLGVSKENVKRLRKGQPISFDGEELGLSKTKIVIFYGKTEKDMQEDLKAAGLI